MSSSFLAITLRFLTITICPLNYCREVLPQSEPFLDELTNMYERNKEKGSVWVTFKRSSMKSKAKRRKMESGGEVIEYRCLVRATDSKKTISTSLSAKEYLQFQASYGAILKKHMDALMGKEEETAED